MTSKFNEILMSNPSNYSGDSNGTIASCNFIDTPSDLGVFGRLLKNGMV